MIILSNETQPLKWNELINSLQIYKSHYSSVEGLYMFQLIV